MTANEEGKSLLDSSALRFDDEPNPPILSDNPLKWPRAFRWRIVALLCLMSFNVYAEHREPMFSFGSVTPADLTFQAPSSASPSCP